MNTSVLNEHGRIVLCLMDAGLSTGEAANVIAEALDTVDCAVEDFRLAVARVLQARIERVAASTEHIIGDYQAAAEAVVA